MTNVQSNEFAFIDDQIASKQETKEKPKKERKIIVRSNLDNQMPHLFGFNR